MASERTSSLEEEKEKGKRKLKERGRKRAFRVRSSYFSLDFSTIGSSNISEAGGKVDPHCKVYAWVLGLWSFDNSRRYSYSVISCLKCHENGFGNCEVENGHVFRSQRNWTKCLMRGLSLDSPRLDLGMFKTVWN